MKRNKKRAAAALLALVLLFTDCASGFAAETNMEPNEPEILEEITESDLTEETQEEIPQDTFADEEPPQVLFEMEELREQSTKQFRLSDGSILAAQYGMDVHYEAEEGEWKEIDNRFLYEAAEDESDFAGYKSAEGAVEFKFAPQVQEGELVKITHNDYEVGFELLPPVEENDSEMLMTAMMDEVEASEETEEMEVMQEEEASEAQTTELFPAQISFLQGEVLNVEEVPAELTAAPAAMALEDEAEVVWADVNEAELGEDAELLEGTKAEDAVTSVGYGNVLPGVSLQYILSGSSLKEYILVNEKADSYSYDFSMNLVNLKPQMQEDGSILLNDEESGETVYEIPAGYMTDAAGAYSDAVAMSIVENEEGKWILNVTADAEWINAEERVLPIQIDPTLNKMHESASNMRGCYVEQGNEEMENENPGNLMIGYKPGPQEMRTYIQFRNLPALPPNSVICKSTCYFDVITVTPTDGPGLNVLVQKVPDNLPWDYEFTWEDQPTVDPKIMDYLKLTTPDTSYKYVGWDVTELVKEHYDDPNAANRVSTFAMIGYGADEMHAYHRSKVKLCLFRSAGYPFFSVTYRDTKGVEGYFTYQTHSAGNAGTAYVGDYNGQVTVVKPVGFYESSIMSYGLNLVYNSAYHDQYFTNDGNRIHSKNFTNMKLGVGWKLSAQETIMTVTLEDVNSWGDSTQSTWLVYNDSDGTEHYFKQSSSDTSLYEDEDGLNLKITKQDSVTYIMKDKQDNEKTFKNGYLTKLQDANGNRIHIVYNGGTPNSNVPNASGSNRITAVYSQPKNGDLTKIFGLIYDGENCLTNIEETYTSTSSAYRKSYQIGYEEKDGIKYLKRIENKVGSEGDECARYGYTNNIRSLNYLIDSESGIGLHYVYTESITGYRIGSYNMYSGNNEGSKVYVSGDNHRKTIYRDEGADKTQNTADDVITTYLFNQCGQTVNVSSRDQSGTLLGVTSSAYTSNSGTSGKNNRLTQSVSSGQSGANLLRNGGFEKITHEGNDIYSADGWSKTINVGSVSCRKTTPRSGDVHYNLYNDSVNGKQMISQSVWLKGSCTYTASVYVKFPQVENVTAGKGVYLEIRDANGNVKAKGDVLSYPANENIEGGWQRISLSYQAPANATYKVCLVWDGVKGTVRADDMQLEMAEAPGSYSYVSNGSFENNFADWTRNYVGLETAEENNENQKTIHGSGAFSTKGEPGRALYAEQTILLNKSSDTTFMLSGWSKAYSIASVEQITDNTNSGTGKKFWGISLKFTYSDDTVEYHFLPFSEYVREWQYASMAVVPKKPGKKIKTATIRCSYYNNANTARFDNVSLTEEPTQTYAYDKDGNLTSVKSSGNGEEIYEYNSGTQNLMSVGTEGSGTYEYEYQTTGNKHLPVKVKNGTVSMEVKYDAYGEAVETVLSNTQNSQKMKSTANYSNGLLVSQTDNSGTTTNYTYSTARDLETTTYANGQKIQTYKDLLWNRTDRTYQKNFVSADYCYDQGNLVKIIRGGYLEEKPELQENVEPPEKIVQNYEFSYDKFGNRTMAKISNEAGTEERILATYDYNDNFENLTRMTYGPENQPLTAVNYTYDHLDRVKSVTYDNDNDNEADVTYHYKYSSDGSLSGILKNGQRAYDYSYDSLGRLIYSTKFENGIPVLRTSHSYDTSDRITAQDWQIGADAFSESYTYNSQDGTLSTMKIGANDTLSFSYNGLKQLSKRTSPRLDMSYKYQQVTMGGQTYNSTRVSELQYTANGDSPGSLPTLKYSYDAIGNITKVTSGSAELISYRYDKQNQLAAAITQDCNYSYSYDTYGNILSKTNYYPYVNKSEVYTFTYGDEVWKDLLKKVSYKDLDGNEVCMELEYDAIGNPVEYFNGKTEWEFEWTNGRQLSKALRFVDGEEIRVTNTYDVDGVRESKMVGGILHNYVTLDGKVVRETCLNSTVDYFYDNDGRPYKFTVKVGANDPVEGYYVLNLQGDVIAILDKDGAVAVEYEYDSWGNILMDSAAEQTGQTGQTLKFYNALKYRGYYYDADLEMYYLNSRFYDPAISRFINADSGISGNGEELLGYNMFTYCFNNPVNLDDSEGNWPKWAKKVAIGVAVIAAAAIVTVATGGAAAGTLAAAVHCVAVGALNGAVVGAAVGAATGAAKAVVKHRVTTGSWKGAGAAARDGAADGFMSGAITGAITGGATSNACFVAGTAVLTALGYTAIEEIKAGDKVWSENPETGERGLKEVVQTFVSETDELVYVHVNGEKIITTPEHPFYVPKKGWVGAIDLRAGDILVLQSGEYVVIELIQHEILEAPITVYNFEVEDFHTYYVSDSAVLVHNVCSTNSARRSAVKKAWKNEVDNVSSGGTGISREWTDLERLELLTNGKVSGYYGHHVYSVNGHPNLAGDPSNIQFLTYAEHLNAHGGNWRNVTPLRIFE